VGGAGLIAQAHWELERPAVVGECGAVEAWRAEGRGGIVGELRICRYIKRLDAQTLTTATIERQRFFAAVTNALDPCRRG
jgi:hypothetical protein